MKRILYFFFMMLVACPSLLFVACSDDDDMNSATDREFMTMFITDNTRGRGTDYPYNCGLDGNYPHGNTIHLYWYGVNDCAGYQIQMALQPKVSGGDDAWNSIQEQAICCSTLSSDLMCSIWLSLTCSILPTIALPSAHCRRRMTT